LASSRLSRAAFHNGICSASQASCFALRAGAPRCRLRCFSTFERQYSVQYILLFLLGNSVLHRGHIFICTLCTIKYLMSRLVVTPAPAPLDAPTGRASPIAPIGAHRGARLDLTVALASRAARLVQRLNRHSNPGARTKRAFQPFAL
jgi:hypothetical protein